MSYTRINWKNYPIRSTPLSAENLNKMDEGIQSLYDTYLPLSGGLQHKISGTVYLDNNDISFINLNRKAGFRVYNIEENKNWGQIMLTTDASVNDSERVVMNAYNSSKNGYQCLWMSDSDELTYFFQAGTDGTGEKTTLWKVFDDGHAEVRTMGITPNSVATRAYVDANAGGGGSGGSGGTKLYKHTLALPAEDDGTIPYVIIINTQKEAYTIVSGLSLSHCVAVYVVKTATSEVVLSKTQGLTTFSGSTISLDASTFTDTVSEL